MGCCCCRCCYKPNIRKKNYDNYGKDTFINPIYIEEEEPPPPSPPPPKIKLNRKSKEEYCNNATEFLKELDIFLDTS